MVAQETEVKDFKYTFIEMFNGYVKVVCNICGKAVGIFYKTPYSLYEYIKTEDVFKVMVDENGIVYEFYSSDEDFKVMNN